MALGLLVDGKMDLVKSIVEHCIFEIKHYNKVLNGNRSYVSDNDRSAANPNLVPCSFAASVPYRSRPAGVQSA